jgi:hypothetical protein
VIRNGLSALFLALILPAVVHAGGLISRPIFAPKVQAADAGGGAEGWVDLGQVVDDFTKTGSDPYVVTVDTTVEAGNVIVCAAATDNGGDGDDDNDWNGVSGGGATWISDVTGMENEVDPGSAGAGSAVQIFYSLITVDLTAGTTLGLNLPTSRNSKACVCEEFSVPTGAVVSSTGTWQKEDVGGGDAGSLTLGSIPNLEHLWVRAVASETGTAETITETAGWTKRTTQTTGGTDNTNQSIYMEFIIATGTSQASDPAFSGSFDRASVLGAIDEAH